MPTQHPFIDMHTHLFTARYLPLHGIFRSAGVPNFLARGLARTANSITDISDFDGADDESQDELVDVLLSRDADRLMWVTTRKTRVMIRRYQDSSENSREEEERLKEALGGLDDLEAELGFEDADPRPFSSRILQGKRLDAESVFRGDADVPDELDNLLARGFSLGGKKLSESGFLHDAAHLHLEDTFDVGTDRGLKATGLDSSQIGGIRQLLLFVGVMALSERNRFKILKKDYDKGKPENGVDASHYVSVLMDMHEAYVEVWGDELKPPYFEFKRQMSRMNALAQESGGQLISFGAVDPFRSRDWKNFVEQGVAHGAKGFKIYCPLGYRPIDDRTYATPVDPEAQHEYADRAKEPAPSSHAQRAIGDIVPYFAQKGLRLFTHCTPMGFQVKEGYGVYADPELWRRAIESSGAQDLWLFLAHGGGTTKIDWDGWAAKTDEDFKKSFAWRVIRMVQDYENVYLGLGYFEELLTGSNLDRRQRIFDRLRYHIKSDKPAGALYHFRDKVCYGTDWSMPQAIGRTRDYLNTFYTFFSDPEISQHAPAFFEGNARRYLGMTTAV